MPAVCVLGAGGFIGKNLIDGTNWVGVTRHDLDLTDQIAVETYFKDHKYDIVIHCGVVGGSRLNVDKGDVFHKNILMFEKRCSSFQRKVVIFFEWCRSSRRSTNGSIWTFKMDH